MKMLRWLGFPVRLLVFAMMGIIYLPVVTIFFPEELSWVGIRKDWYRWVLKDFDYTPYRVEKRKRLTLSPSPDCTPSEQHRSTADRPS
jgi:hypothetical protein